MVSHNAGISTATTGPAPLINGQVYDAAAVHTNFTSGNVTTAMLMGSRVVAGKEDYGLLSYRDWQETERAPCQAECRIISRTTD